MTRPPPAGGAGSPPALAGWTRMARRGLAGGSRLGGAGGFIASRRGARPVAAGGCQKTKTPARLTRRALWVLSRLGGGQDASGRPTSGTLSKNSPVSRNTTALLPNGPVSSMK